MNSSARLKLWPAPLGVRRSGLDPAQYFGVARELYERAKVPESLSASDSTKSLSVDEIETAFESSNPWLKP
jgi:ribonuclease I